MFMLFRNVSFRVKIFIIIFIAILLPTVMVGLILYKKSEQAITDQASRVVTSSLRFAIQNIDSSLDAVIGMSDLVMEDNRLTSVVNTRNKFDYNEKIQKYAGVRELLGFVLSMIKARNVLAGIDSFYVYIPNQNTIIDSKTTFYENINENNVEFLQKPKHEEYNNSWFVSDPVDYYTINNIKSRLAGSKVITYSRFLKDEYGNLLAVLAINISESYLSEYYKRIQTGIPGDFLVVDKSGYIVVHSDKNMIGEKLEEYSELNNRISKYGSKSGSFFLRTGNEEKFAAYSVSEYTKWAYLVMVPSSRILAKVEEMKKFLFVIISVTVLLVLGITVLLSYIFYKPLEKLVLAMHMIEKRNLDIRIDDKRADEYQKVYKCFNDMVGELNSLIKNLTNEKILKKEAEIKLLQAQINPHFLYNTLESIHSIAKIKKVEEISLMVLALSKFFRTSLSGGKDTVTLSEAVELAVNYLTIQNIRFKGKILYEINIPEELMEYKVPKLILQPIVENSVYHGIERRKGKGVISICGELAKGVLSLAVVDDGIGIEEESLIELRDSIGNESFEDSKNFALKNLNRQIKLKYGQDFGLNVESQFGKGTCVTVRLPAV